MENHELLIFNTLKLRPFKNFREVKDVQKNLRQIYKPK